VSAQLRDVFATKDSAVVPQEDNHGGTLLPERAEPDVAAPGLWEHNIGEPLAHRFHDGTIVSDSRPSYFRGLIGTSIVECTT
jgi:hypothetical protein